MPPAEKRSFAAILAVGVTVLLAVITGSVGYGMLINRVSSVETQVASMSGSLVPRKENEAIWRDQSARLAEITAAVHRIEDRLESRR